MPLSDPTADNEGGGRPANLPLWRIPEETAKQRQAIEQHREHLAAAAAEQLLAGEFERLSGADWARRTAQGQVMQTRLCELRLEPFRRWSAGFSCLCFVWVGAPMAVWLRNRDFLTSFFLCFAPILIVYYPLLAYGINGAKNGTIPPISVWAGNLLLAAWGAWVLRKVLRY
jgi:lipopolysaccharide export system permease protein